MQAEGHSPRALRKPRRIARERKAALTQGEPPKQPEPNRQQGLSELVGRQPGDWPPNTWWP